MNRNHGDECTCDVCHESAAHRWQDWTVYPECDSCLSDLAEWIHENTDSECLIPEYCNYPTHRNRRVTNATRTTATA